MRFFKTSLALLLLSSCNRVPEPPSGSASTESDDVVEEETEDQPAEVPPEEVEAEEEEVATMDPPPPPVALTLDVIKGLCAGTKTSMLQPVTIPARTNGCQYGVPPNTQPSQGSIRAREIDAVSVALSTDMVICDVSITSRVPTLFFNDDMYFLMDKYVIASDIEQFVTKFDVVNGLRVWNFDKIYNSNNLNSDLKNPYCVGGPGTCVTQEIPSTEFRSAVTSAQIAPIAAELIGQEGVSFSLVVTGDDAGAEDCVHDEYPLDIKIDYVQNPNMQAE
ncbi:MAG: hypothetical protein AB7T49_06335 [Oligoflexales bacterium]